MIGTEAPVPRRVAADQIGLAREAVHRDGENLARFARNCGAEIPRWLHYRLESLESDATGTREFAEEFVASLCRRLLEGGAPGLHFYTMNQAEPTLAIARGAGLL